MGNIQYREIDIDVTSREVYDAISYKGESLYEARVLRERLARCVRSKEAYEEEVRKVKERMTLLVVEEEKKRLVDQRKVFAREDINEVDGGTLCSVFTLHRNIEEEVNRMLIDHDQYLQFLMRKRIREQVSKRNDENLILEGSCDQSGDQKKEKAAEDIKAASQSDSREEEKEANLESLILASAIEILVSRVDQKNSVSLTQMRKSLLEINDFSKQTMSEEKESLDFTVDSAMSNLASAFFQGFRILLEKEELKATEGFSLTFSLVRLVYYSQNLCQMCEVLRFILEKNLYSFLKHPELPRLNLSGIRLVEVSKASKKTHTFKKNCVEELEIKTVVVTTHTLNLETEDYTCAFKRNTSHPDDGYEEYHRLDSKEGSANALLFRLKNELWRYCPDENLRSISCTKNYSNYYSRSIDLEQRPSNKYQDVDMERVTGVGDKICIVIRIPPKKEVRLLTYSEKGKLLHDVAIEIEIKSSTFLVGGLSSFVMICDEDALLKIVSIDSGRIIETHQLEEPVHGFDEYSKQICAVNKTKGTISWMDVHMKPNISIFDPLFDSSYYTNNSDVSKLFRTDDNEFDEVKFQKQQHEIDEAKKKNEGSSEEVIMNANNCVKFGVIHHYLKSILETCNFYLQSDTLDNRTDILSNPQTVINELLSVMETILKVKCSEVVSVCITSCLCCVQCVFEVLEKFRPDRKLENILTDECIIHIADLMDKCSEKLKVKDAAQIFKSQKNKIESYLEQRLKKIGRENKKNDQKLDFSDQPEKRSRLVAKINELFDGFDEEKRNIWLDDMVKNVSKVLDEEYKISRTLYSYYNNDERKLSDQYLNSLANLQCALDVFFDRIDEFDNKKLESAASKIYASLNNSITGFRDIMRDEMSSYSETDNARNVFMANVYMADSISFYLILKLSLFKTVPFEDEKIKEAMVYAAGFYVSSSEAYLVPPQSYDEERFLNVILKEKVVWKDDAEKKLIKTFEVSLQHPEMIQVNNPNYKDSLIFQQIDSETDWYEDYSETHQNTTPISYHFARRLKIVIDCSKKEGEGEEKLVISTLNRPPAPLYYHNQYLFTKSREISFETIEKLNEELRAQEFLKLSETAFKLSYIFYYNNQYLHLMTGYEWQLIQKMKTKLDKEALSSEAVCNSNTYYNRIAGDCYYNSRSRLEYTRPSSFV